MASDAAGHRLFEPLRSRYPWVIWGLIIQVLGVGSVAVVVWRSVRNQSFGSHVTAQMIKFAWHSQLHTRTGLVVLIAGAVVYAIGSVVMVRPYATRPVTLFVAVPIAAVAGMLLLGVLVLVIALIIGALESGDVLDVGVPRRRNGPRRRGGPH